MNYIELMNNFWRLNKEYSFTPNEKSVYFALLNKCNELGWKNPFNQSNGYLAMDSGMSEPAMTKARNILKQKGLIDFKAGDGRRNNTIYSLKGKTTFDLSDNNNVDSVVDNSEKGKTTFALSENTEPESNKGKTTFGLSVTLSDTLYGTLSVPLSDENGLDNTKQESKLNKTKLKENSTTTDEAFFEKNENPDFVEKNREAASEILKNKITSVNLTENILQNERCKIAAKNAEVSVEEYPQAVERFVSDKFGLGGNKKWKDMADALQNFEYWVKFYKQIIEADGRPARIFKNAEKTGRSIVEQPTTDDSILEQGADGVLRRVSGKGVQTFAG